MSVRIQTDDFDMQQEYLVLRDDAPHIGAIVTFTGLVREFTNGQALQLEHFPGMAESQLKRIIQQARERWSIINCRVVHRIGHLALGEQIVFVGVNSEHRTDAFQACQFIMDFLKVQAPFWKKAITHNREYWIEAKATDTEAQQQWLK